MQINFAGFDKHPTFALPIQKGSLKYVATHPYQIVPPIVVLAVLMLCFNMLADGLREAFDPKLKEM